MDESGETTLDPNTVGGSSASAAESGGGFLSGLGGLFSGVGTAVSSVYKAVNPTVTTPGQGGLVYNPATGTYVPVGSVAPIGGLSNNSMLLVIVGVGLGLILLLRK